MGTAELENDKQEFERRIHAERANCRGLRESFDKLRSEHQASYRAAFEGPVHQISALEGAISEIQRSSETELAAFRQRAEKLRHRAEELEGELSRMQTKLQQTEHEVQDGT